MNIHELRDKYKKERKKIQTMFLYEKRNITWCSGSN